jgi:hypothetical protein
MNRHEALRFIRENSRMVRSILINPTPKIGRDEYYEENYEEQRIGNNGQIFILTDYGRHGWDLYFPTGNNIDKTMQEFSNKTGCALT